LLWIFDVARLAMKTVLCVYVKLWITFLVGDVFVNSGWTIT